MTRLANPASGRAMFWLACLLAIAGSASAANPLEDDFGTAAPMVGVTNVTASNILATAQLLEPDHAGEPANRSLWAIWTAPSTGTYSLSTSNSLNARRLYLDTVLAVYTGTVLTNLSLVTSNDDAIPFNLWSRVFFRAHAGETFHIAVDVIGTTTNSVGTINLQIDQPTPLMTPWTASGVNRGTISSQNYSNRILLVDFWETTCVACVEEFPELVLLHQSMEPKGLSIVGLSVDPDVELVENYLDDHPVPYAIGLDSVSASKSLGGAVGMPSKYLVDAEGRIVARFYGAVSPISNTFAFYENAVNLLLRPDPRVNLGVSSAPGQLKIYWPATGSAFQLESASDPSATTWNPALGPIETNNGILQITLPMTEPAQFFRLKNP